jgi:tetratricopeptide (TPR) repeat protein
MDALEQIDRFLPNSAVTIYHLLKQYDVRHIRLYHKLGERLLQQQQFEQAIEVYQHALRLNPQNPWIHHSLAKALQGQRQYADAIASCQRAIDLNDTASWFYDTLGTCLMTQGQWQEAIAALDRALELNPEHRWTYYHLGLALLETEQWNRAVALYQTAVERYPDFAEFQQKLDYAQHVQQQRPMNMATLLKHPPHLHGQSGNVSWKASDELLQFIAEQVTDTAHTLETGAGVSTIVFALKQTVHTCIVPDAAQVDRIRAYCDRFQISTEKVTFHITPSEAALPQLELNDLDLVLIDGRHAFPTPFIDWYYTASRLKVGGVSIVDDTKIWTGAVLKEFLEHEAEWQLKAEFPKTSPNSAAFVKLSDGSHQKWWAQQPYVMQRSQTANIVV